MFDLSQKQRELSTKSSDLAFNN